MLFVTGVKEGDPLIVTGPNGAQFNVVVPLGLGPGQPFAVQLPQQVPAVPIVAQVVAYDAPMA